MGTVHKCHDGCRISDGYASGVRATQCGRDLIGRPGWHPHIVRECAVALREEQNSIPDLNVSHAKVEAGKRSISPRLTNQIHLVDRRERCCREGTKSTAQPGRHAEEPFILFGVQTFTLHKHDRLVTYLTV